MTDVQEFHPLITIVMPVYNGTNYLQESVNSALAQTYDNIEIVVVNDGSTDDGATDALAQSLARQYPDKIRYFSKENGGVSSALNLALEKARGRWFSWLSHDDLYYPDKIKAQVDYIGELLRKNPNIDLDRVVLRCGAELIDADGKVIYSKKRSGVKEWEPIIETILNNIYYYRLSGCAFLTPLDAVKKIGGFNEELRAVSDAEYWYRLLFAGYDFYYVDRRLVQSRMHKSQVGKTRVALCKREIEELHLWFIERIWENEEWRKSAIFLRLYIYLCKRELNDAAKRALTYWRRLDRSLSDRVKIRVYGLGYSCFGKARGMVRDIFYALKVK
ncbi:MAG: glycosyltransferase [Thermoguttaceae bacterium]|nr:glycosyltransferase [Thermoguttaceae bacterium]